MFSTFAKANRFPWKNPSIESRGWALALVLLFSPDVPDQVYCAALQQEFKHSSDNKQENRPIQAGSLANWGCQRFLAEQIHWLHPSRCGDTFQGSNGSPCLYPRGAYGSQILCFVSSGSCRSFLGFFHCLSITALTLCRYWIIYPFLS